MLVKDYGKCANYIFKFFLSYTLRYVLGMVLHRVTRLLVFHYCTLVKRQPVQTGKEKSRSFAA